MNISSSQDTIVDNKFLKDTYDSLREDATQLGMTPKEISNYLSEKFSNAELDMIKNIKQIDSIVGILKEEIDKIRPTILDYILRKDNDSITETIVNFIMERKYIYTTRRDEKPEMFIYHDGIYVPNGRTFVKEVCRSILSKFYTTRLINIIMTKIETDTYIEPSVFFEEESIDEMPVQNGILNIFTRELSEFTPKKRFFTKLPVSYDPKATCPAIEQHLRGVLVTENDFKIIQETAGYSLLRDSRYETAQIWFGDGSNGKGKTQELFKRFVGVENVSGVTLSELEKDRFAKARLHKKLLNLAGEVGARPLKDTESFKTITGRDLIEADRKFKDTIKFVNYAKPIFNANKIPITEDRSHAFWRRWIMIIFPYTFVDKDKLDPKNKFHKVKDPEIISKITTQPELDGFLNFALDGLDRLIEQKKFTENDATRDIKDYWIRMSNSFEGFFIDCIEMCDNIEIKADIQKAYLEYCRVNRIKPVGSKTIKEVMYANGVGEDRTTVGETKRYVWTGVKLNISTMKTMVFISKGSGNGE